MASHGSGVDITIALISRHKRLIINITELDDFTKKERSEINS